MQITHFLLKPCVTLLFRIKSLMINSIEKSGLIRIIREKTGQNTSYI